MRDRLDRLAHDVAHLREEPDSDLVRASLALVAGWVTWPDGPAACGVVVLGLAALAVTLEALRALLGERGRGR